MTRSRRKPKSIWDINLSNNSFPKLKLPKMKDPLGQVLRSARRTGKINYDIKIPKISMPKPQPIRISLPKITYPKPQPIPKILLPKISTQSSIFNPRPAERILPPRASDTIFNERMVRRPAVIPIGRTYNSTPTLADIIKDVKRRFDEHREKTSRAFEAERQARIQADLQRRKRQDMIFQPPVITHTQTEHQISQIREGVAQNTKDISDLKNDVKQVSDDVNELKKKLAILEPYKQTLTEGIAKLVKYIDENKNNAEFITLLSELLKEKEKTEKEIAEIQAKLEQVVEQQKKDKPFVEWWKKATEDSKDYHVI